MAEAPARQLSRTGTVAVRRIYRGKSGTALRSLAARQRRTMNDMIAEALEDLFRKHAEVDR